MWATTFRSIPSSQGFIQNRSIYNSNRITRIRKHYSDEFAARTFFGERCVQIEADQCGHAGSKSEVCSQQMSRQSETGKRHVCCCISDQNQQRQSDQNQQRQRVSFQHVQRRAKGAVRREKKSGDDMHAGQVIHQRSSVQLRIRTRLGKGRGMGYGSSPTNVDIAVPNTLLFWSLLQRNNHKLSALTRQNEGAKKL